VTLEQIAVFVGLALLYALVAPARWRGWTVFLVSLIAIFWLQPTLNIRWLDFSLPAITLAITLICWRITSSALSSDTPDSPSPYTWGGVISSLHLTLDDALALFLMIAVTLVLAFARIFPPLETLQITSRPPELWQVVAGMAIVGLIVGIISTVGAQRAKSDSQAKPANLGVKFALLAIIVVFILLKAPPLTTSLAQFLRGQAGLDVTLALPRDIEWLGFSYVAFRLIHTLRDKQMGILPTLSLREYVTYVIFFSAYTAGPIDRAERFVEDYRKLPALNGRDADRITRGVERIVVGMFKKFVIADSLALFSLNAINAEQAVNSGALWVMLYAYAFRLYFDFAGYSDIAIGVAQLFGINLPENFNAPYTKQSIAAFWNSWHMTLSNWARSYVYSPLSRALLRRKNKPPANLIILICHVSTMVIIGLWHGMTAAFIVWGLWHGLGLFVHKLWSDRTRQCYIKLKQQPQRLQIWTLVGILLTFHFVLLGWVWFALSDFNQGLRIFGRLFGIGF
jgi:alginate O-acetyltransferase complex protein AlgI